LQLFLHRFHLPRNSRLALGCNTPPRHAAFIRAFNEHSLLFVAFWLMQKIRTNSSWMRNLRVLQLFLKELALELFMVKAEPFIEVD
jgi:hypothetical protein